jgi:hypothetical protein
MFKSARCDKAREIFEDIFRKNVFEEQAQIVFNRVNPVK